MRGEDPEHVMGWCAFGLRVSLKAEARDGSFGLIGNLEELISPDACPR